MRIVSHALVRFASPGPDKAREEAEMLQLFRAMSQQFSLDFAEDLKVRVTRGLISSKTDMDSVKIGILEMLQDYGMNSLSCDIYTTAYDTTNPSFPIVQIAYACKK